MAFHWLCPKYIGKWPDLYAKHDNIVYDIYKIIQLYWLIFKIWFVYSYRSSDTVNCECFQLSEYQFSYYRWWFGWFIKKERHLTHLYVHIYVLDSNYIESITTLARLYVYINSNLLCWQYHVCILSKTCVSYNFHISYRYMLWRIVLQIK